MSSSYSDCNSDDARTTVNLVDPTRNVSPSCPREGSIKLESFSSPAPLNSEQEVKPSLEREHNLVEDGDWNVHFHAAAACKLVSIFLSFIQSLLEYQ